MDPNNTVEVVVETEALKHRLGKTVVGSFAAFTANQLAEKAYDHVLAMYRAKRS